MSFTNKKAPIFLVIGPVIVHDPAEAALIVRGTSEISFWIERSKSPLNVVTPTLEYKDLTSNKVVSVILLIVGDELIPFTEIDSPTIKVPLPEFNVKILLFTIDAVRYPLEPLLLPSINAGTLNVMLLAIETLVNVSMSYKNASNLLVWFVYAASFNLKS